MNRSRSVVCLALVAACGVFVASPVAAQPAQVTPPRVVERVEAPYPEGIPDPREVVVGLELVVGEDGRASDVRVVASGGAPFDEAAQGAVTRFVFEPARRAGAPIAARIRYEYVFLPPAAPPPSPAPTEPPPPREPAAPPPAAAEPEPAADDDTPTYGAVAEVEAVPRDVTERTLEREVVTSAAGTRGDTLKALELMPGVARPPLTGGFLVIRGTSPDDSEVNLEGAPVFYLYHGGGLTSFFHSQLLDSLELYPGNFSARYGRKIGGIVEVGVRDPRLDSIHAFADVNLLDASLILEAPIGDRAAFAVAARRSYVDFFFEQLFGDEGVQVLAAPVYYDYQAIAVWHPTARDRLRFLGYGSDDTFKVLFEDPSNGDPSFHGELGGSSGFHQAQVDWDHRISPRAEQRLQLTVGRLRERFVAGDIFQIEVTAPVLYGRAEWRWAVARGLRLTGGLDVQKYWGHLTLHGPPPTADEGTTDLGAGRSAVEALEYDRSIDFFRPAAYAEVEVGALHPLTLVGGVRVDHYAEIDATTIDPRLSARLALTDDTALKGGVGLFSKPPEFEEAIPGLTNPDLGPAHAVQAGLGVEHELGETLSLGVEGYWRWIYDRVVGTEDGLAPYYVNDGVGRIYGLEVSAKLAPTGRFYGLVSYGLSRSERRDRGGPWRLFDYDQPHSLVVAGGWRIGAGWEASATFRLVSGNPATPFVGGVYDAQNDIYRPVGGPVNSERDPLFHRLDLRVQKTWTVGLLRLSAYVDVQNVYNERPQEGHYYDYDYRDGGPVEGLPILPTIGLRGEL